MTYSTPSLYELLQLVAQKSGRTLEHADAGFIADDINAEVNSEAEITREYIYETHRKTKKALENNKGGIEFSPAHINTMAQYLGFRDFKEFEKSGDDSKKDASTSSDGSPASERNHQVTNIGKNINHFSGDVNNTTINNN